MTLLTLLGCSHKPETAGQMNDLVERLEKVDPIEWNTPMLESVIRGYAEEIGTGAGKLIHPLRLCITGKRVGAGMFETMEVLGKTTSTERIRDYVGKL